MNVLITVIVPIYKVEPYLDRCVESIVRQTYPNLEILLVDDGSPDACPALCDAWAARDPRVRVIHKSNGGLSDARNAGLAVAAGEYICFVDSDDFLEPDYARTLYTLCTSEAVDIAECEWDRVTEPTVIGNRTPEADAQFYTPEEALREHIADRIFRQTVVNKLYRAELLRDEPFPPGKTNEDEFWTYRILGKAQGLTHTDAVLYHYFQRPGSIIQSAYSLKRLDGVEAKKRRMEYIQKHFPALTQAAGLAYIGACKGAYQSICANRALDPERRERKRLHAEFKTYFICPKQPWKEKVWYRLFYFFPEFTCRVRNRLKIGL